MALRTAGAKAASGDGAAGGDRPPDRGEGQRHEQVERELDLERPRLPDQRLERVRRVGLGQRERGQHLAGRGVPGPVAQVDEREHDPCGREQAQRAVAEVRGERGARRAEDERVDERPCDQEAREREEEVDADRQRPQHPLADRGERLLRPERPAGAEQEARDVDRAGRDVQGDDAEHRDAAERVAGGEPRRARGGRGGRGPRRRGGGRRRHAVEVTDVAVMRSK